MSEHPQAGQAQTPEIYVSKVNRRTTLAWLGAASVAVTAANGGLALKAQAAVPVPQGYGTDPNLLHPSAPWPRLLSKDQLQTAALLCDFILPASADAPSANAVGVPDFIDEWISAPYPEQLLDRPAIIDGLKWVEAESRRRFGKGLFDAAPMDREALLQTLAVRPTTTAMLGPHGFFRKFRSLTIGAYYTTHAGFKDIGYIGNVALPAYPGPSDAVKAVLDRELKKLGL